MTQSIQEQLTALGITAEVPVEEKQPSPFTFDTNDCIAMRHAVLRFYSGICGVKTIPNVVDAKHPWEDVLSDFQMLIYLYMLMEAQREIDRAANITLPNGQKVIRKAAKPFLQYLRNDIKRIITFAPMNDIDFCSQYADIDEQVGERMQQLVTRTYYPLLNNMLHESREVVSEVAQVEAHLVTALCLAILACEKGMGGNHNVPCPVLFEVGNRICRLASATSLVNDAGIDFNTDQLEKTITATMNIVINLTNGTMEQLCRHAETLDLADYIAAAELTKDEFHRRVQQINQRRKHNLMRIRR